MLAYVVKIDEDDRDLAWCVCSKLYPIDDGTINDHNIQAFGESEIIASKTTNKTG